MSFVECHIFFVSFLFGTPLKKFVFLPVVYTSSSSFVSTKSCAVVRQLTQRRIDRSFVLSRSKGYFIGSVMGRYPHRNKTTGQDFVFVWSVLQALQLFSLRAVILSRYHLSAGLRILTHTHHFLLFLKEKKKNNSCYFYNIPFFSLSRICAECFRFLFLQVAGARHVIYFFTARWPPL